MSRTTAPASQPKPSLVPAQSSELCQRRQILATTHIVPDPRNRKIAEDEEFQGLVDSIRVLGVLQPVHVLEREGGTFLLIDGERRWRAAQRAGLEEIPCDVWPARSSARAVMLAGLALNEQRKAPGCLHVARRLRDIKNDHALTQEQLAAETGVALDRIKNYFSLFLGSDFLLRFCEDHDLPLRVAVAFVRYERATNEARVRRLAQRYAREPLTREEIDGLRKRAETKGREDGDTSPSQRIQPSRARRLLERFETEYRREGSGAQAELEELVRRLGFRLVRAEGEQA
jgi:ParB family chromosome partitioning protein